MGGPAQPTTTTVEAVKTTTVTLDKGSDTKTVTDEAIVKAAEAEKTPVS